MKLIIDSRMRQIEKQYLSQFGELIEIEPQTSAYPEISAHPDIFFCKINDTIFQAPNIDIKIGKQGSKNITTEYPNDICYNICQIGNNIIHNFKYTDPTILEYINDYNLVKIQVNQGYTKCSITPTSSNSCITSDTGIHETLKSKNIDSLLLDENSIGLLDINGSKSKMNGFIGGASTIINNTFILFGDINKIKQKNELLEHLIKHNLQIKEFKNLDIIDYGGVIYTS